MDAVPVSHVPCVLFLVSLLSHRHPHPILVGSCPACIPQIQSLRGVGRSPRAPCAYAPAALAPIHQASGKFFPKISAWLNHSLVFRSSLKCHILGEVFPGLPVSNSNNPTPTLDLSILYPAFLFLLAFCHRLINHVF